MWCYHEYFYEAIRKIIPVIPSYLDHWHICANSCLTGQGKKKLIESQSLNFYNDKTSKKNNHKFSLCRLALFQLEDKVMSLFLCFLEGEGVCVCSLL